MKGLLKNAAPARVMTWLAVVAFYAPTPVVAAWWWPFGDDGIPYEIEVNGVDTATKEWLDKTNVTARNKTAPPTNVEELEQEASVIGGNIKKALEAKGFYDATVQNRITPPETEKSKQEKSKQGHTLIYTVNPGQRYTISSIRFAWQGTPVKKILLSDIATAPKQPVDAKIIEQDAEALLKIIGKDACLLSLQVTPLLELNGRTRRADLVFKIANGPKANFGATTLLGNEDVNDQVILRAVRWKQGECFQQAKIDQTMGVLMNNQLLSSVRIAPAELPDSMGEVPMTITVKERVPRTIKAGANYSTDQGFGVTGGWEHRNLFGNAEKFNADAVLAQDEQSLNTTLRFPYFFSEKQNLVLNFGVEREDRDAYEANSVTMGATVERRLSKAWNTGLGVNYTLTQTDDKLTGRNDYGLLSFPGFLTFDTRDNTIDTRRGILANLWVTPYTETFGDGGRFIKTQGNVQTYLSADIALKPTLALKATAGNITGADGADVPSDIRFYAGGGGSVRGYSYQSLGPQSEDTPVGGSSMLTFSTEMRLRFNDDFGGVAFVDAGNSYEHGAPELNRKLYYGAGVGIRYFTAAGPLRFDVAVPLNGDDINETGYAIYVSLGQAF